MASLERILVPTDFSASSYAALGYAVFLAGRIGAELEVVHIAEPSESLEDDTKLVEGNGPVQTYAQLLRGKGEMAMKRFLRDVPGSQGLHIRSRVEVGNAATVILSIAKGDGFDMIVMGTRGRAGIELAVLGSVAEKVIRSAPCPVLTVRVPEVKR